MIRLTLQEYLDKHHITRYALSQQTGIRYHIIDKYYKNKIVRYDGYVLDKICSVLGCRIEDILTHE